MHLATEAGVADAFMVDSAGTGSWHVGESADTRMRAAAARRGVTINSIARDVTPEDFVTFDHIFAMDASNLRTLRSRAPAEHRHKIRLYRELDPEGRGEDVPDPYYGDARGFDDVLDIVTRTSYALLSDLRPSPQ